MTAITEGVGRPAFIYKALDILLFTYTLDDDAVFYPWHGCLSPSESKNGSFGKRVEIDLFGS